MVSNLRKYESFMSTNILNIYRSVFFLGFILDRLNSLNYEALIENKKSGTKSTGL